MRGDVVLGMDMPSNNVFLRHCLKFCVQRPASYAVCRSKILEQTWTSPVEFTGKKVIGYRYNLRISNGTTNPGSLDRHVGGISGA